jgi:predicted  nucleic acid-binding Zn-ribbon protein
VHILTKIFVVLVALLTVAIVPLVAVNATNEASFQKKFKDAQTAQRAAEALLESERSVWLASQQKLESSLRESETRVADLQKQVDAKGAAVRKAEQELAGAKSAQASMAASLEVLAQSGKASTELTDALVAELRTLRERSMDAEKRLVEMQEAYDASQSDLEVADAARRALQEENKRLSDEKDKAVATVAEYVATVGELSRARAGAVGDSARVVATKNMAATVINVRRGGEAPLAEINAGSRDGVRAGWVFAIGEGSTFVANLRITEVDVNRAVGVIELEDAGARGEVKAGQRAVARAGE